MMETTAAAVTASPIRTDFRDPPDRDQLIAGHMALATSLARRFANRGETLDDLVQTAMIGLVKAATRYDPIHETQFSTFATATVLGELKRHFRDKRWGMHVTRTAQERYLLVRDATEWATQDLGRSPTVDEIAERAGVTPEIVLEAQEVAVAFHIESIDAPRPASEDREVQIRSIDRGMASADDRLTLESLIDLLPTRERRIIKLRFVDELTQSQIAAELGLSQMQVSRLLSRTMAKLRESMVA